MKRCLAALSFLTILPLPGIELEDDEIELTNYMAELIESQKSNSEITIDDVVLAEKSVLNEVILNRLEPNIRIRC